MKGSTEQPQYPHRACTAHTPRLILPLCTRPQFEGFWVPFPERANFCLSVLLYCCTDFRFFGVVLTCQVLRILKLPRHHRFLKPVRLSENDGTFDQQLEACRSMPQHAAASQNFLGDRWCLATAVSMSSPSHSSCIPPSLCSTDIGQQQHPTKCCLTALCVLTLV